MIVLEVSSVVLGTTYLSCVLKTVNGTDGDTIIRLSYY